MDTCAVWQSGVIGKTNRKRFVNELWSRQLASSLQPEHEAYDRDHSERGEEAINCRNNLWRVLDYFLNSSYHAQVIFTIII